MSSSMMPEVRQDLQEPWEEGAEADPVSGAH